MALVLRTVKGSALTWPELDGNFTYLQGEIDAANTGSFLGTVAGGVSFIGTASYALNSAGGGGSSITINNNTNNNILTATGNASIINGESNLTFDGSTLSVTGDLSVTGNTTLGNAATDTVTIQAATMSLGGGTGVLNIDSNTLYVNGASNTVAIGSNNNGDVIAGTDYLKIVASGSGGGASTTFGFSNNNNTGQGFMSVTNGTVTGYGAHTNNTDGMVFGSTTSHPITLRTSNTNRLQISSTGQVYLYNLTNTSYPNIITYNSSTNQLNYIPTSSLNANTASYVTGSIFGSNNLALSASYAVTSSYALSSSYAITSSYVVSSSYATTASYVVSSSYAATASYVPSIKAGKVTAASFSGTPLVTTVTFGTPYSSNNYAVSVVGADPRTWTILSKSSTNFEIHSNSSTALTGDVYWTAIPFNS